MRSQKSLIWASFGVKFRWTWLDWIIQPHYCFYKKIPSKKDHYSLTSRGLNSEEMVVSRKRVPDSSHAAGGKKKIEASERNNKKKLSNTEKLKK